MSLKVSVFRHLREGVVPDHPVDADVTPRLKVRVLTEADKSDPLNQHRVVFFRAGMGFAARITIEKHESLDEALAALFEVAIEHAAEIRDALGVRA